MLASVEFNHKLNSLKHSHASRPFLVNVVFGIQLVVSKMPTAHMVHTAGSNAKMLVFSTIAMSGAVISTTVKVVAMYVHRFTRTRATSTRHIATRCWSCGPAKTSKRTTKSWLIGAAIKWTIESSFFFKKNTKIWPKGPSTLRRPKIC